MSHIFSSAGKRRRPRLALALLAVLASVFALPPAGAAAATQAGDWGVSTAATNGPDNGFKGVDAVGPNDVWAVGATNLFTAGAVPNTLIEHWNGTRWSIVPSPNRTGLPSSGFTNSNVLNAVDAISATDVWAVGYTGINGFSGSGSLVEHWNGSSWSIVTSPNGVLPSFSFYNVLLGVSGTAANDVWAVGWNGFIEDPGLHRPTIQHWDGTQWTLTTVPPIGNDAQNIVVQAVTALAPNDAWATGFYGDEGNGPITHPLTLHWDGTQWSVVNGADVGLSDTFNQIDLNAVSAISANDVWAAGDIRYVDAQGAGQSQALIEHWDGTRWSPVINPMPLATATTLTGIAPFAADDIWAVGTIGEPVNGGFRTPLLEHWDGSSWSIVDGPALDKNYSCGFFGAAATAGSAQAVGACIAIDSATQPLATPLVELFPAGTTGGGTAPAAPSGLTAAAISRSQIRLNWQDNSDNEAGFSVERCQGSGCTSFTEIAVLGPGVTTLLDGGLARNTSYTYRVRAFNSDGTSAYSNPATTTTRR